jgi:hypothetical protein
MNNTFCTIITADYYPFVEALLESLIKQSSKTIKLEVLISENIVDKSFFYSFENDNLRFTYIEDVKYPIAEKIYNKYYTSYMDGYRWSMKSVFIIYLLEQKNYEKVIYLDSDLFFYNDPQFLFEMLKEFRVILTPHWRCAENPTENMPDFIINFIDGIFNAGFVGVNKNGIEVMRFWANLCLTACEKNRYNGLYVDQKYLDILHSRFEGIGIVRHKGCNVSNWNINDCKRVVDANRNVMINAIYPIIFIHFTFPLMVTILNGIDRELMPHFQIYAETIKKYNPKEDLMEKARKYIEEIQLKIIKEELRKNSLIYKIRCKIRIRTRIKKLIKLCHRHFLE